jgi:CheY-like chemotaxis protein
MTGPPPGPAPVKPRVLVAEDNRITQRVFKAMLERCGCQVDLVSTGIEAVGRVQQICYELVLMDCQMPGMDGWAATEEIRRLQRGVDPTPVVAVTASVFREDVERCQKAGMDDFVAKPIQIDTMRAIVLKWIPSLNGHLGSSGPANAPIRVCGRPLETADVLG